MIKSIDLSSADPQRAIAEIQGLKDSEDFVVFRGGERAFGSAGWIDLLERCGLSPDLRHFDANWAASDARRRAAAFGAAELGGNDAAAEPVAEQIKKEVWWEVSYQPDKASAYAYSKTAQPLHTDNAWFSEPAEINFFIMKKQAIAGGEQTVYPGSRLVEDLRRKQPGLLDDLCSIEVVIKKGDHGDFNRTTIIRTRPTLALYWNYYRTERSNPAVSRMCEAFFAFLQEQEQTASVERVRCSTGDCFSFNDTKMLHGRTAFQADAAYDRVLLHSMWKRPAAG